MDAIALKNKEVFGLSFHQISKPWPSWPFYAKTSDDGAAKLLNEASALPSTVKVLSPPLLLELWHMFHYYPWRRRSQWKAAGKNKSFEVKPSAWKKTFATFLRLVIQFLIFFANYNRILMAPILFFSFKLTLENKKFKEIEEIENSGFFLL